MRWIASASAGALVAVIALVLLSPEPVLWEWIAAHS
jgi:hypothetical protein